MRGNSEKQPIEFGDSGLHRWTNRNTVILCEETAGLIPIEFGDSGSHRWTNRWAGSAEHIIVFSIIT